MKQAILLITQDESENNANPTINEITNSLGFQVTFLKVSNGKYRTEQTFEPNLTGFISATVNSITDVKTWIDDENGDNTKHIFIESECNCDNFLFNHLVQIYVKEEINYTNEQLSTILYAKSVLVKKGLIELANKI